MLLLTQIIRVKKLSAAVLFSYVLLYLCIIFHFHPLHLNTSYESIKIDYSSTPSGSKHNSFHCQVCHIITSFNYLDVSEKYSLSVKLFDSQVIVSDETLPLAQTLFTPQLRAPPII